MEPSNDLDLIDAAALGRLLKLRRSRSTAWCATEICRLSASAQNASGFKSKPCCNGLMLPTFEAAAALRFDEADDGAASLADKVHRRAYLAEWSASR